jgi:hypothetical protein
MEPTGKDIEDGGPECSRDNVAAAAAEWRYSDQRVRVRRVSKFAATLLVVLIVTAGAILTYQQFLSQPMIYAAQADVDGLRLVNARASSDAQSAAGNVAQLQTALNKEVDGSGGGVAGIGPVARQLRSELDAARATAALAGAKADSSQAALSDAERRLSDAQSRTQGLGPAWYIYGIASALILFVGAMIVSFYRAEQRRDWENKNLVARLAKSVLSDSTTGDISLDQMWKQNQERLQEYHSIVVNYAASTRQSTLISLLAGFALIAGLSVMTLLADGLTAAITSSVVASAGALVTGYVAKAVLRNSEASSRELTQFFIHPVKIEQMLLAERMIRTMNDGNINPAMMTLVESLVDLRPEKDAAGRHSESAKAEG